MSVKWFLMLVMGFLGSTVANAHHCSYENHKVEKYEGEVAEWEMKVEACKLEQETDDSTTCYWQIKRTARKQNKLDFWNKMLTSCQTAPHCSLQKHKVKKYEAKVAKWDAKVEACKLEQETDDSTTCFWQIKRAAKHQDKLDFWDKMLSKCQH